VLYDNLTQRKSFKSSLWGTTRHAIAVPAAAIHAPTGLESRLATCRNPERGGAHGYESSRSVAAARNSQHYWVGLGPSRQSRNNVQKPRARLELAVSSVAAA
jgi:hypothetical protein